MAPPPRSRLASPIPLPAPPTQLTHLTRQRRSDIPAAGIHSKEELHEVSSHSKDSNTESESSETGTNTSGTDDDDDDKGNIIFILLFFHCFDLFFFSFLGTNEGIIFLILSLFKLMYSFSQATCQ